MDFRGTYTPLHAFREAYAKARAIGVNLSDSSESDSSDDTRMPSTLTGARRSLNLEMVTEQRLEKMDTTQEVQSLTAGGSPRGGISPRPPSSTARRPSVPRVTAFTPKLLAPMTKAAGGRLPGSGDQYAAPTPVARALLSEASPPSPSLELAAEGHGPPSGKQTAASMRGNGLHVKQKLGSQMQTEVSAKGTYMSEGCSVADLQEAHQDASKQHLQSPSPTLSVQGRQQGAATSQGGLDPSGVSPSPEGGPFGVSPKPPAGPSGASPKPTERPSGMSPKSSGDLSRVSPRPSGVPQGVSPKPSVGPSAEPQDWSTLLGQEAVKQTSSSARLGNCSTAVVTAPPPVAPVRASSFRTATVPFQAAAAVPFKPAAVPFRPAAVLPHQAESATSGSRSVVAPLPFQPKAVPLEPTATPAEMRESPHHPAPTLPFEPAKMPFEAAGLPSVASGSPLTSSAAGQAGPKAASPLLTRPTKAGLPITLPASMAGLPITGPAPVAQPAPKSSEATRLPVTPPSSRAPGATGIPSHPLPPASAASALMSNQASPVGPGISTNRTAIAEAAATSLKESTVQTHEATEQRLEPRQAAPIPTASESASKGTAASDISLAPNVSAQAACRRYPRARNQIVQAVKAHAQAVPEAVGDGSAVLEHGLEEVAAQMASKGRFPRARSPIVNAVKARALAFVAGQAVRVEQAAAAAVAGEEESGDVSKPTPGATPSFNLNKVNSGSKPITPPPAAGLVTPKAGMATGSQKQPVASPSLVAHPSGTPPAGHAAFAPGASPPPSAARTLPFSTPPPQRTPPQGSLVSEHSHRRSASAKKPPLHPHASPGPLLTPPAQADSAAKLQSSAPTATHTPPGTSKVDSAAELAEDLPRRSPLTQRGLTKQQWAELQQQQQQMAIKPPRKPLSFQYPAGYPWLPEPKQQGLTTAAASEAAQAAAPSPNALATGHASNAPLASPARIPTEAVIEAALPQVTTSASPRSAVAPGAGLGSGGAAVDGPGRHTPHKPPPSAGRGSESGVSTSEPTSLSAEGRLFPAPPEASRSSRKKNGAVPLQFNVQAPGAMGKPSPLMTRPGKAEVLAGTEGVRQGSPRAPWEIKASAPPTLSPLTVSPLARKYAATPGIGVAAAAAAASGHQEWAQDDDISADMRQKSQQRRAQKVTKHKLRGERKAGRSWGLTAMTLLLLCVGGGFLAAPHPHLPLPAAKLQTAISGVAVQTANRLPHMVPTPSSDPLTELDSASWQAHSFPAPLQVWHQLKLSAGSYLPNSLLKAAPASWSLAAPKDSGAETRRDADQVAKQVLSWPGLQQLRGKVAGTLPGLVPMGLKPSTEDQKQSQVESAWVQHAVPAVAAWRHPLHTTSNLAGSLISKTAAWLLDGLESVKGLAGLTPSQAGDVIRMASLPEYESGSKSAEQPYDTFESAVDKTKQTAKAPSSETAEAASPSLDPPTAQIMPAEATAQPSAVSTQPAVTPVLLEAPTAVTGHVALGPDFAPHEAADNTSEPAMAALEVSASPSEAAVVELEPGMVESEPAVASPELAVVMPEPAVVAAQPAVAADEPGVTESEPAGGSSESAVASLEPNQEVREAILVGPAAGVVSVKARLEMPQEKQAPSTGDMVAATSRPCAPESEAAMNPKSSAPLPVILEAPSAVLREPHESSEVQGTSQPPDAPSDTYATQPVSEGDDSPTQPDSHHFSHLAPAKLRQLLSWLAAKHLSGQLTDHIGQAPRVISSAPRQPVESAHTELAEPESMQLQDAESAELQSAMSAQLSQAESEQSESQGAESDRTDARTHKPLLPAAVLPDLQFFLLSSASLLLAWVISSLLIRCFTSLLTRPTVLEAQNSHEEEQEEEASPEVGQSASEGAEEEEQQQNEQGMGLVTRARSVARSMSEAVSGMVTSRSEAHEAEEVGLEAESAPGGSGAGRRGARPRGRRELAALGDLSQVDMTPRRSRQAPERFTVDSYDGRSKDIRKYHRSETLLQNVDSLSLRNRTVLTPTPAEAAAASNSRELRSLKRTGR